jgi:excinuclease ABC subunit A
MLRVRGARTHNLKNIDLDIPKHALVVITGLSGSGKSSLAFDTLYAEGQRRYVESLSAYARQFLQLMDKPDVDVIEGLSPAISIEQKATSHNPRSTVGTITEIHDYLRLLYARAGTPFCPDHDLPLQAQSVGQMVDAVLALPEDTRLMVLSPVVRDRKGEFTELFADMQARGYVRFRIDGQVVEAADLPELKKNEKHDIDVVIDRLKARPDLQAAPGRELRGRAARGRRQGHRAGDGHRPRAPLLQQASPARCAATRCPSWSRGCSASTRRWAPARTATAWASQTVFDAERVVAFPSPEPGRRRGEGLGPAQRLHPLDAGERGAALRLRHRHAVRGPAARARSRCCCTARAATGASSSSTKPKRQGQARRSSARTRSKGIMPNFERRFRETDSAAVREDLARYQSVKPCPACGGTRLRREARHVFLQGPDPALPRPGHLPGRAAATLAQCQAHFDALHLVGNKADIAEKVMREIRSRLNFLNDVGLTYLSLDRSADTLSGGESQRIRLASQIGSGLTGVMYVLDEPSIGLHQRDNERLIGTLRHLRDLGNSVLVVEHDEDMIRAADHVVDLGPGAGVHGGRVIAQGTPARWRPTPHR